MVEVTGVTSWHINADEIPLFDYNDDILDPAEPSTATLWSPNHEFMPIEVLGVTDPEGDAITITIVSIFQDEAVDAPGSGNTAPDRQGVGTSIAEVRAEDCRS